MVREDNRFRDQGLRKYAEGGFIGSPGYGAEDYQGIEGGTAGRRNSSVPLTSSRVQTKPWVGRPRLERIGSTSDLVGMADFGGAVREGFTPRSPSTPVTQPITTTTAAPASVPATNPLDNSAKDYKWDPSQRSSWAKGLTGGSLRTAEMPTVGESMGTDFGNAFATNKKTGYPVVMADGGKVPMARWGGPTEDNESTRVHSPIYKGPGGIWDGMPMFADGGRVWKPSMGVNIPKGGAAVMTQRGTGRKIVLSRGLRGLADGGAVPHGRVTKDYFEDVKTLMANGGGVDGDGVIFGDNSGIDKQMIMATPGEVVIPKDSADEIGRKKLARMIKATHTPMHLNRGLRGGYEDGGGVDEPGRLRKSWRWTRNAVSDMWGKGKSLVTDRAAAPAADAPAANRIPPSEFKAAQAAREAAQARAVGESASRLQAAEAANAARTAVPPGTPGYTPNWTGGPQGTGAPPPQPRPIPMSGGPTPPPGSGISSVTKGIGDLADTGLSKVQRARDLVNNSRLVKGAVPLTLGATALATASTDTGEYRKRFGLENPESAGYGTKWMAEPGFWSDVAVRGLGAASDLGNILTGGLAGELYRDKQEKPPTAVKEDKGPGVKFAQDPGPKGADQRENQGIPIPARTGLRQGEDLPAVDARGQRIDATELEPIQGGGYISGVDPKTGQQRLVKYTKEAMPLPMGITDTSTPEEKAADKARRADWTAQSAAIDAKNAAAAEAENRRLDDMVARNAMNSAAYNRREGLRGGNAAQYMSGMRDEDLVQQTAQRRAVTDAAAQQNAATMARTKMQADAEKYRTDVGAASSKYSADVGFQKEVMADRRARDAALAGLREKHGADFDKFLDTSSVVIDPATGKPDLGAQQTRKDEFMKWAYAPAVNNEKFLKNFGGAKSIDDLPKSQWAPLWQSFQTARSQTKDLPVDAGDVGPEGLPTDVNVRPLRWGDWYNPRSSREQNAIGLLKNAWGMTEPINPFVSPEQATVLQTGSQGSKIQNTLLSESQYDTPAKRMALIKGLREAGRTREAEDLRQIFWGK